MHKMYSDKFPNEAYRQIFVKDFNVSFGYPRSDTCSACNQHIVKLKSLQEKLGSTINNKTVWITKSNEKSRKSK